MRAPDTVIDPIRDLVQLLNGPEWPCERSRSCIDAEGARDEERAAKRSDGMRMGWHGYDPARMCPACAAAWHVACAYNFALGVRR